MQLLFDFLPIVAFFIGFKFFGIYAATGIAIVISLILVVAYWIQHRTVPGLQLVNLGIITLLGGTTLLLHNELFIKWKPTVLNWVLALVFLGTQLFAEKPLIQKLLESKVSLPKQVWQNLNSSWIVFFSIMGLLNILVAYNFDTNTWVNFKLFGILGLTLVFAILQAVYLSKHVKEKSHDF